MPSDHSENAPTTYWHVTSAANAAAILEEGFEGGYGDDGFGVYLFSDLGAAEDYAAENGWDRSLVDPVLLEVRCDPRLIWDIDIQPDWPNPEDYEFVHRFPMREDDQNWKPSITLLLTSEEPKPC